MSVSERTVLVTPVLSTFRVSAVKSQVCENLTRIGVSNRLVFILPPVTIMAVMPRACPNVECGVDNISREAAYCPRCGSTLSTGKRTDHPEDPAWYHAVIMILIPLSFALLLAVCHAKAH